MRGEAPQRDPFRSERDAFRLLWVVTAGVAAIVVAFTLGGEWVGVPVAAVLIALAARAGYRWLRVGLGPRDPRA